MAEQLEISGEPGLPPYGELEDVSTLGHLATVAVVDKNTDVLGANEEHEQSGQNITAAPLPSGAMPTMPWGENCLPDPDDFDDIVVAFSEPLRNYVRCMLSGDEGLTQDIVQETLWALYRALQAGQQLRKLSSWLYRVAGNRARDDLRRRKVICFEPLPDHSASEDGAAPSELVVDPSEAIDEQLVRQQTIDSLRQHLPPRYWIALEAYYIEGQSYAEIAKRLDIPASGMKMHLYRARQRAREVLARAG